MKNKEIKTYGMTEEHFKNVLKANNDALNSLEKCMEKLFDILPEKEKEEFMNTTGFNAYFTLFGSYDFIIRRLIQYPKETKQLIEKYDKRESWFRKII